MYIENNKEIEIRFRGFFECKRNNWSLLHILIGIVFIALAIYNNWNKDLYSTGMFLCIYGACMGLTLNILLPPPIKVKENEKQNSIE